MVKATQEDVNRIIREKNIQVPNPTDPKGSSFKFNRAQRVDKLIGIERALAEEGKEYKFSEITEQERQQASQPGGIVALRKRQADERNKEEQRERTIQKLSKQKQEEVTKEKVIQEKKETPNTVRRTLVSSLFERQGKKITSTDDTITFTEGERETTIITSKGSGERGRSFTVPKSAKVSSEFGEEVNKKTPPPKEELKFSTKLTSDIDSDKGQRKELKFNNNAKFLATSAKRAVTDVLGAPTKGFTGAAEKSGILPALRKGESKLDIAARRQLQDTSFAPSTSKERSDVLKQRVGTVQNQEQINNTNQSISQFSQSKTPIKVRDNNLIKVSAGSALKAGSVGLGLIKTGFEKPVTTALTVSAIGKGSQFIATKTGSNFIANTVTGTGLTGLASVTAPKGERLFTAVGFAPIVAAPSAVRFVQNRVTAFGSERVPLESITTKEVATGKARFPTTSSIKESVKAFKNAPKNPKGDILITSATTTNFAKETAVGQGGRPEFKVVDSSGKTIKSFARSTGTEASRKAAAESVAKQIGGSVKRVATETEGLYTTPADKTSIQFTGLAVARTPVEQTSPQLFARPQIIRLDAKSVERVPQSIIKKEGSSFELSNKFIKSKAGTGKIFITPRSEKGGTSEIEAVVPFTSKIKNVAGQGKPGLKGAIARAKGYEQYVRIDNRNVPIKDFNQVITSKSVPSPAQKGGVSVQNVGSIAKQFKQSSSSLSRFASERPLARLPSISSSSKPTRSSSKPVSSSPKLSSSPIRSTSISSSFSRSSSPITSSSPLRSSTSRSSVSRSSLSTSISRTSLSPSISRGTSSTSISRVTSRPSTSPGLPRTTKTPPTKIPTFNGIDTKSVLGPRVQTKSKRKFIGTPSLSVLSGFAVGEKLTKAQREGRAIINPLQRRSL